MIDNIYAINILTELKDSGFMGKSTNEALQYGIDCILYVTKVKGIKDHFERLDGGNE